MNRHRAIINLACFIVVALLIRIVAYRALVAVFGFDPVDDLDLFVALAAHPVDQFFGQIGVIRQFPPLFSIFVWPIDLMLGAGINPSVAVRVLFVIFEGIFLAPLVWKSAKEWNYPMLALWAICPPTIAASTIFVQDEIISAALIMIVLIYFGSHENRFTSIIFTVLFCTAKIFFAPVAVFYAKRKGYFVYTACIIIVLVGYGGRIVNPGGQIFVPGNSFGVSFWSFSFMSVIDVEYMYIVSVFTILISTIIFWFLLREREIKNSNFVFFLLSYLIVAFFLLYHANPEYYILLFSLIGFAYYSGYLGRFDILIYSLTLSFPYAHNVLNGFKKAPLIMDMVGSGAISFGQDAIIGLFMLLNVWMARRFWHLATTESPSSSTGAPPSIDRLND